tara:strand:- start:529 stop:756 length:228 start_codon:yes stop_codon:yes gene_type:complete
MEYTESESNELQEKLCEISHKIINKLDGDISFSEEEKSELHMSNDSMLFFIEQGNWERALEEGKRTLNRIVEITE